MGNLDKAATARLLFEHGLARALVHRIPLSDMHRLLELYPNGERLVARTSREGTAARNLPRLVDATAESIVEWSRDLEPGMTVLVGPYTHLIASAEVALTPSWVLVEVVFGVWELDNRQRPAVARGVREAAGIRWTQRAISTAPSRRRFAFDPGIDPDGPVSGWLLSAFCSWVASHASVLDAVALVAGQPQIVKVLFSSEYGMEALNARPLGDFADPTVDDISCPPGATVVSRNDQIVMPTPAIVLLVSAAREDAASLDLLIGRLQRAGVKDVYLESGLLSHVAIALREAGMRVFRR